MINMDQYKREDVTHLLECKFYNSQRSHVYFMPCIKLSETKRGKVKVVLFGWRDRDESSLIVPQASHLYVSIYLTYCLE